MKRFIMALAMFCALAVPALSWAQATSMPPEGYVAPHRATTAVFFRTHINSKYGVAGVSGVDNVAPFVDSTYTSTQTGAKFDTTAYISTDGWTAPFRGSAYAGDTTIVFRFNVYDAAVSGNPTGTTTDSLYCKVQVSPDGNNWKDASIIPGVLPAVNVWALPATTSPSVISQVTNGEAGLSGKTWSFPFKEGDQTAGASDQSDIKHLLSWPFIRFIITGTRTTVGVFAANVSYYTASPLRDR